MPVYLRAVQKDELGNGLRLQCLRAVRVYRSALAKSFLEALGDPGYDEILAQLTVQAQRVLLKRRQEAQAHRRMSKQGKK